MFDPELVAAVAADAGVAAADLSELVERHQASVAELPGTEDLVYEWRKHFADPVVRRTERAYYLSVPDHVWDEFGADLGASADALGALMDVHRRTVAARTDADAEPSSGRAYVVLDRRRDE